MTRGAEIYVSKKVLWLLRQIAKSMSAQGSDTDPKITPDALAEDILVQWVKTNRPKLLDLYSRREALDAEAQEILK